MSTTEHGQSPEQQNIFHANVIDQTPDIARVDVHAGQAPSRTHEAIQSERIRLLKVARDSGALTLSHTDAQSLQVQATANVYGNNNLIQG